EVGWQLEARNIPWSDPLAGVGTKECDAGFAWLGATTDPQCDHVVVAEEPIMLAVSSDHRLAARPEVTFADIAQEALVALPAEAGVLRSFWLAEHARDDTCPATVSCLSTTADAALENVAAGRGSVLLAAGNAQLYGREGLCFLPVVDLPPARLAFLWRAADDRSIIAHAARIMGGASSDAFSL
ncbi:MAG: LysR substrate-binding domain-containing protein, partial [Corynebacterium matruchotii]